MQIKQLIQITSLCIGCYQYSYSSATSAITSDSCHAVILCKTSDNSKQTYTAYLENQKTYQCYYQTGDTYMAKLAAKAMTECQIMYSSINPIIRQN